MSVMRDAAGGLAILAATAGGVAAVTLGLGTLLAPGSATAEPTPTPEPIFDLAVAPGAIGGSLEFEGDRTGTLTLDRPSGIGPSHVERDGQVFIRPNQEDAMLRGADGRISFERDTGGVTLIEYDGLAFYLDPGQCTVTHGEVNPENDLMAALIECREIADIRGQGIVSVRGVIAMPSEVLRGRGDLPPTGGSVEVAGASLVFDEAEVFLRGEPNEETGRVDWGIFTDRTSGVILQYDPEDDRFFLIAVMSNDEHATLSEPCPIAAEELGRLNELTTVVRLDIECTDVAVPSGASGSVTGSLVADVIQGLTETLTEP